MKIRDFVNLYLNGKIEVHLELLKYMHDWTVWKSIVVNATRDADNTTIMILKTYLFTYFMATLSVRGNGIKMAEQVEFNDSDEDEIEENAAEDGDYVAFEIARIPDNLSTKFRSVWKYHTRRHYTLTLQLFYVQATSIAYRTSQKLQNN